MINIHTEWDPLKEIVVGNIGKWSNVHPDFSFLLYYQDNIKNVFLENSIELQQHVINQRQEDLDEMAIKLEALGILVHRPLPLEKLFPFETPEFKEWPSSCHNPRDQFLVVGNEIIETSCQWRKRYFENDFMKPILLEQFQQGAKWTASPRPVMGINSFDLEHIKTFGGADKLLENWQEKPEALEIMFDGAQCLKFGKDIVMNIRTKNHELGLKWLQRHFDCRYRFHPVKLTDNHIDGMFMPLAEGKLLINSGGMKEKLHLLPDFLKKWDVIDSQSISKEKGSKGDVELASAHININVLPLGPKKTMIFDSTADGDNPLREVLLKHGIESLHTRMRHCRLFDGGLHCASLDLNREGDYREL
jgi:glycine amidinotransferase